MLKKITYFFTHQLWAINVHPSSRLKKTFVTSSQIFFSSTFKFYKQNEFLRVASLTYYTINSLVPLLTFMLWITTRFAIQKDFKRMLINFQPEYKDLILTLFKFSNNMIHALANSIFLLVGIGFLLWSVFSLMNNIEQAINDVWGMKKGRGLGKRIFLHFLIVGLFPFIMFFSVTINVVMQKGVTDLINGLDILSSTINYGVKIFFELISYSMLALLFSLVYYIFPTKKIKWKSAFIGGCIAGLLFFLFQELYVSSQIGVSRANAIYGGFAAIPLFFLWIYSSWTIILYGVHLSYHIEHYPSFTTFRKEKTSIVTLKKLCLGIYRSIEKFGEKRTLRALHKHEIATLYKTSIQQLDLALSYLIDAKLIQEYEAVPHTYCLTDLERTYSDKELLAKIEELYADEVIMVETEQ